ncbi:metallopeptidase TldD-related protein [Cyanobium sp. FGCU-52]|nr:metallopeptidase TldD-related protein [Cyanobium sp. FGCU52]
MQTALREDILSEVNAIVRADKWQGARSCDIVLAPVLAAQLVHECIGHTLEVDNYNDYGKSAGFSLGCRISPLPLSVWDDPTRFGHPGSFIYDDKGYRARPIQLVKDGIVTGILGGTYSDRARRVSGVVECLPRMSITWMEPCKTQSDSMIHGIDEGWFCCGTWGGGSIGETAVLRPAFGQRIQNGRLTGEFCRRFDIVGLKRMLVGSIDCIGNDLRLFEPVMGCDKYGQDNLPVSMGAPTIRMRGVELRGF